MLHHLHTLACKTGLTTTRCPVCGVMISGEGTTLCQTCAEELRQRTTGYCIQCGIFFGDQDAPPTICAECRHTPPPWETLHFHGPYSGILRKMILRYKFKGNFGWTRLLAHLASSAFRAKDTITPDIIVPVPLHPRRLLKRGFNQSLEIARALGEQLEVPVLTDGLTRTRHTPPQTRLGRTARQHNIKDAFQAHPDRITDKTILLLDDVYTTGSTLSECARTLKRAGATRVDVLVLARAQER